MKELIVKEIIRFAFVFIIVFFMGYFMKSKNSLTLSLVISFIFILGDILEYKIKNRKK